MISSKGSTPSCHLYSFSPSQYSQRSYVCHTGLEPRTSRSQICYSRVRASPWTDVCIRTYRLIKYAEKQRAEVSVDAYGTDVYTWSDLALSGPPTEGAKALELATDPIVRSRRRRDAIRFASPPLTVLSTGEARVATRKVERSMSAPCDAPCSLPCNHTMHASAEHIECQLC